MHVRVDILGIDLSRATMCGLAIKAANACEPLMDLLAEQIRSGPMQIDETPVQVMKEPGRANTTQSYMWGYRGGTREHPVLIFHYHPTRSGQVPFEFLDGYKGYVQTDGYKGYDGLLHHDGIVLLACWSHARRNFVKVIDAKPNPKKAGLAEEALSLIGKLYGIEDYARKNDFIPS